MLGGIVLAMVLAMFMRETGPRERVRLYIQASVWGCLSKVWAADVRSHSHSQ